MSHADVKHTMQWGWINVYNNQDRHFHHPESSLLTPFYWSPSILGSRCFDLGYQDFTFSWIFMQNGEWTEFVYVSDFFLLVVLEIHSCCQFSSVSQSCPTLCNPMHCSTPDFPVHHQLPELTQTHVHRVCDAIQPSHPLSSPSPPAFNLSQQQGLFKWVSSLH